MTTLQYRSLMSPSDAIIWNLERDPQLRSTIMSVWMLDQVPTPERMAVNIQRMIAAIPRLRQHVVPGSPRPSWQAVTPDLDHHYDRTELPEGSTWRDVLDFAEEWVCDPFDRDRPLWKLGLVSGLEDGKAAIVIKVHHAIADGMGMVLMLAAFTDIEPDPPFKVITDAPDSDLDDRVVFSPVERIRHRAQTIAAAVATGARTPVTASGAFVRTLQSAVRLVTPHRTPHSRLMTERSESLHMDTRILDFDAMQQAARARNVSLNDLFVTMTTEALTRYHASLGAQCPRLRLHMPVDVRNHRTAVLAGNQFVPARISLTLEKPSTELPVESISNQLAALQEEPALHHINSVSAALQRLGRPISCWIVGGMMKGVDVLASNVPGPPFPLYLAGAKVEQFFGFGPPAGAALNVTLFSYDGSVWLGITSDAAAVTDRQRFLDCLDEVISQTIADPANQALASAS